MPTTKTWIKPNIEVTLIRSAKSGSFNVTDAKHTHRST